MYSIAMLSFADLPARECTFASGSLLHPACKKLKVGGVTFACFILIYLALINVHLSDFVGAQWKTTEYRWNKIHHWNYLGEHFGINRGKYWALGAFWENANIAFIAPKNDFWGENNALVWLYLQSWTWFDVIIIFGHRSIFVGISARRASEAEIQTNND